MTTGWTPFVAIAALVVVLGPTTARGPLPSPQAMAAIVQEMQPSVVEVPAAIIPEPEAAVPPELAEILTPTVEFEPKVEVQAELAMPSAPTWRNPRRAMLADDEQLGCLAKNAYFEARGEGEEGMLAVAHVTLNRVAHPKYPEQICAVVHQGAERFPCQFHWVCDGTPDRIRDMAQWDVAQEVARRAMMEPDADPTRGALYFHNVSLSPKWAKGRYEQATIIGQHVFFQLEDREHAGNQRVADNIAVAQSDHRDVVKPIEARRDVAQAGKSGEEVALIGITGEDHGGIPAEARE
jgi:N-acetylmuramoyl-L-alanine amidase